MKLTKTIIGAFILFGLMVGSAHAVQKMKRIQGPTSWSIGSPSGNGTTAGTMVARSGCDKVMLGVFLKSTNTGAKAIAPYADVATTSTGTAYRTANLGAMGGTSVYFWRELTAPASSYIRPVFTYTAGFTGTTELWCQYTDGSQ